MSKVYKHVNFAGPADKELIIETDTGSVYRFDKSMATMVSDFKTIPLKDLLSIFKISDSAMQRELEERKAILSAKALKYLKSSWYYSETGDKVHIDQEFIEDFLNQTVKKRTVYRRLKERRMSVREVKLIIDFFNENNFTRK